MLATLIEGNPKTLLSIATTPSCRRGHYSFSWIGLLYPDNAEYKARMYDSTWDWTLLSQATGENSNQ